MYRKRKRCQEHSQAGERGHLLRSKCDQEYTFVRGLGSGRFPPQIRVQTHRGQ